MQQLSLNATLASQVLPILFLPLPPSPSPLLSLTDPATEGRLRGKETAGELPATRHLRQRPLLQCPQYQLMSLLLTQ